MSSHHVVREKQEPALLVLGLDGFDDELLGQLLEWSPTVIATGKTAETIHAFGIKIDWIIADVALPELQEDVKLLPAGTDTFAEAALKYLITNSYPAVNVVTDDFQLKDFVFFVDKINVVIFHRDQKIFAVKPGFSQWKPAGHHIEIITQSPNLRYKGLEPLQKNRFQTSQDGFFTLQFDQPFLFIAEAL